MVLEMCASKFIWVTILTLQGHMTFLVTWLFDTQGAISYRCSVVTESVSLAIFEILGPKDIVVTLHDIISRVTSRFDIFHFLLVFHWNWASIFNCFWDIRSPKPVRTPRHTLQVMLYSVPCSVLHWTDNDYAVTVTTTLWLIWFRWLAIAIPHSV